jgi:hypothetical protein
MKKTASTEVALGRLDGVQDEKREILDEYALRRLVATTRAAASSSTRARLRARFHLGVWMYHR